MHRQWNRIQSNSWWCRVVPAARCILQKHSSNLQQWQDGVTVQHSYSASQWHAKHRAFPASLPPVCQNAIVDVSCNWTWHPTTSVWSLAAIWYSKTCPRLVMNRCLTALTAGAKVPSMQLSFAKCSETSELNSRKYRINSTVQLTGATL